LYYVVVVVDVTFKLTGFLKTTVYKCDGRHYLSLKLKRGLTFEVPDTKLRYVQFDQ